jgi:hypothetical protein
MGGATELLDRNVADDVEEPAAEAFRQTQAGKIAERLEERFLNCVFDVGRPSPSARETACACFW